MSCCSRSRSSWASTTGAAAMGWAKDGPQSGYLPFYLCVILAGACLFGLGVTFRAPDARRRRRSSRATSSGACMQVFVPTLALLRADAVARPLRRELPADRGLHALRRPHRVWKSLLTAFLFALIMFATFDIAFDVIMPKGPLEALFGR